LIQRRKSSVDGCGNLQGHLRAATSALGMMYDNAAASHWMVTIRLAVIETDGCHVRVRALGDDRRPSTGPRNAACVRGQGGR
jgi:hypothetical protein